MTPMPTRRLRPRDDRGAALATVALLGTALVLIAAVIVARQMVEFDAGSSDRSWEEALHVAESGADDALYDLTQDETAMDANTVPGSTPLDTREEVLAVADAFPTEETPDGEYVVIKPDDEEVLYAVAYTPSKDAAVRHERVIVIEYQTRYSGRPWEPDHGLLSDGDINANSGSFTGSNGSAHTNGNFNGGGTVFSVCGSGAGNQVSTGPGCTGGPVEAQYIPQIDPLRAHYRSEYDICRAGSSFGSALGVSGLYAGPANTDAGATPATPGVPCSGSFIPGNRDIAGIGSSEVAFRETVPPGSYYIDGADVRLKGKNDAVMRWTIIAGTVDGVLDCSTSGGNVRANSQLALAPAPGGDPYAIVAGADIQMNGGASVVGLVAAHEHLHYGGGMTLVGSTVAEGACDSAGSPESFNKLVGGMDVHYDGNIVSDFILKDRLGVDVVDRLEITGREL